MDSPRKRVTENSVSTIPVSREVRKRKQQKMSEIYTHQGKSE